jgi:hypothetical protein
MPSRSMKADDSDKLSRAAAGEPCEDAPLWVPSAAARGDLR